MPWNDWRIHKEVDYLETTCCQTTSILTHKQQMQNYIFRNMRIVQWGLRPASIGLHHCYATQMPKWLNTPSCCIKITISPTSRTSTASILMNGSETCCAHKLRMTGERMGSIANDTSWPILQFHHYKKGKKPKHWIKIVYPRAEVDTSTKVKAISQTTNLP